MDAQVIGINSLTARGEQGAKYSASHHILQHNPQIDNMSF